LLSRFEVQSVRCDPPSIAPPSRIRTPHAWILGPLARRPASLTAYGRHREEGAPCAPL
jgi:hypothetical protein